MEGRGPGAGDGAAEAALELGPQEAMKFGPPELCPSSVPGGLRSGCILLGGYLGKVLFSIKEKASWLFARVYVGGSRKWLGNLRTSPFPQFLLN